MVQRGEDTPVEAADRPLAQEMGDAPLDPVTCRYHLILLYLCPLSLSPTLHLSVAPSRSICSVMAVCSGAET